MPANTSEIEWLGLNGKARPQAEITLTSIDSNRFRFQVEWLHEYHVACRALLVDYVRSHTGEYGPEHAARALEWIQQATRPIVLEP